MPTSTDTNINFEKLPPRWYCEPSAKRVAKSFCVRMWRMSWTRYCWEDRMIASTHVFLLLLVLFLCSFGLGEYGCGSKGFHVAVRGQSFRSKSPFLSWNWNWFSWKPKTVLYIPVCIAESDWIYKVGMKCVRVQPIGSSLGNSPMSWERFCSLVCVP